MWYYLIQSWEDNGVHTLWKGISPEMNVIVWQDFKAAVQYFSH